MQTALLIIDPQRDFCDPAGALSVAGADQDMIRLAGMLTRLGSRTSKIHVTLDSHHLVHIAHPIFWVDPARQHPAPFTIISAEDVEAGRWAAADPAAQQRAAAYVSALEKHGRYPLCIWPPHCLLGSRGHAVQPVLFEALMNWEEQYHIVDYVEKGSNVYTEHYSAIKADVPDLDDPSTQTNTRLVAALASADVIAVAGEASSHCVANTVRDLADSFGDDRLVSKIVLLQDAVSPVGGFGEYQDRFLSEMTVRGMTLSTTETWLA